MKRAVSILLILTFLILTALPLYATECEHTKYSLREFISPTCIEKGHTRYTCQRCGHIEKVYDDEYDVPDSFYILAESVREDNTLTVTVHLENNPGLAAARILAGYNAEALSLREFINGEIWNEKDFTAGIKTGSNPLSVFTENDSSTEPNNTNSGLYFTLVFDILDPDASYGFYMTHSKADFHSWSRTTLPYVIQTPTIINIVGKSELGPHSYETSTVSPGCTEDGYDLHTCTICDHSYKDTPTPAIGHDHVFIKNLSEPDFENEGVALYGCTACDETEERSIPILEHWMKGDLDNDKNLTAMDANIMKRIMVGRPASLQALDAADVTGDGQVNGLDAYCIKTMLSGK